MSQSLAKILVHLVFSTKEHYPYIEETVESELFAYIGDTIKRLSGMPIKINGMPDHIHILSSMPMTQGAALGCRILHLRCGGAALSIAACGCGFCGKMCHFGF